MSWQDLPFHFRKSVVAHLDYKSRCRFRICSKSMKELVEKCPVTLQTIKFRLGFGKTARLSFHNESFELGKFYPFNDVINSFLMVFENPKSKVNLLYIDGFGRGWDAQAIQVLEDLVTKIKSKKIILNATKFKFWIGVFEEDELFMKFITLMNTKFFESLAIVHKLTISCLEQLTKTDQWMNLKKVGLGEIEKPEIEWFLHLNQFRFQIDKLTPTDAWKLIQSFLDRNLPQGSYFDIGVSNDADVPNILQFFREQKVEVKNEPTTAADFQRYIHTQRFKMQPQNPNEPERVLVVRMSNWQFYGFIALASRLNKQLVLHF